MLHCVIVSPFLSQIRGQVIFIIYKSNISLIMELDYLTAQVVFNNRVLFSLVFVNSVLFSLGDVSLTAFVSGRFLCLGVDL